MSDIGTIHDAADKAWTARVLGDIADADREECQREEQAFELALRHYLFNRHPRGGIVNCLTTLADIMREGKTSDHEAAADFLEQAAKDCDLAYREAV